MCLYSKTFLQKIAKEDIICYKVLMTTPVEGVYETPFYCHTIGQQILKDGEPFMALGEKYVVRHMDLYFNGYMVSSGYIHTFQDLYPAQRLCKLIEKSWETEEKPCIFRCKNPKGIPYFEGVDEDYIPVFASEQIVFWKNWQRTDKMTDIGWMEQNLTSDECKF